MAAKASGEATAAARAPGNLPAEISSFVDRRDDVRRIRQLMAKSRLITLTGVGGIGKSRLAVRVASELRRTFRDGVWLVELASVSDPGLVAETVASKLRGPDPSIRDPLEALTSYLAQRDLLLVIDNCEHLVFACGSVIEPMLRAAPGLCVLATSRELIGVYGEVVYRVDPLPVPGADESPATAAAYPAVSLFADRAAAAMTDFSLSTENVGAVVELCRRLDGMPLAIELAAGYARMLSPTQILDRIDDRFLLLAGGGGTVHPRHRSLRAAVEWSYDLCTGPEQLVWSRLSVFADDFDLAAAEAVCVADGMESGDFMQAIASLVAKSILVSEPRAHAMRLRLPESIRAWGSYQLRERGDSVTVPLSESVLRQRHLKWYVELAEQFDRDWFGPRQQEWLERLRAELPNIRDALMFAAETPERVALGLRLAASLCWFWRVTAMREGTAWLNRLLMIDREYAQPESRERGRALAAVGWMKRTRGQTGVDVAREALQIAQHIDPERLPRTLMILGTLTFQDGDPSATALLREAADRARELGSNAETAYTLFSLGSALALAGQRAAAEPLFEECVDICRASGEQWWLGAVSLVRSLVAWMYDDLDAASAGAADALRASRLVPDFLCCADAVNVIGALAVGHDDRRAAYLLGAADQYWRDAGGSVLHTRPWDVLLGDHVRRCRHALGVATFDAEFQRGKNDPLEDAIARALDEQPMRAQRRQAGSDDFGLTPRERQIAALVAQGLTNKEIAQKLVISTRTAEAHVEHILAKAGFTSRSQIAAWYAQADN